MRKRSVTINGHRTSISLEDAFWRELKSISVARRTSVQMLVEEINSHRGLVNLSSTLRVFVLTELLKRPQLSHSERESAAENHPISGSDHQF
jgi:predicted DNA-binding ribbon-helix-helix protein